MSDLTEIKPISRKSESNESTLVKTVRLTLNLVTNMLMCLTVFVSLLYSFSSEKITVFQMHIILCVVGYQFFMTQGTLVISKYNSWSMYLSRLNRKRLHISFQLFGFALVVTGSSMLMYNEKHHFNSGHGTLGIVALIISSISILNGVLVKYAYKLSRNYMLQIKIVHFICGILTLLFSAAALSTGFEEFPFRMWMKNDDAVKALTFITWLFTLLIALDFWLLSWQKLCKCC